MMAARPLLVVALRAAVRSAPSSPCLAAFARKESHMATRQATTNIAVVNQIRELGDELCDRLKTYLEVATEDHSEDAIDAGIALATRARRVLHDLEMDVWGARDRFEKLAEELGRA
jgi:hypothetical protein